MPVLVVGSIAIDTIRMPNGKLYRDVIGGSCSYFIHSAHYFAPVRVVGVVGGDFPKRYIDGFKKCRADLSGIQTLEDGRTFRWHGTYMDDMNQRSTDVLEFGVLGDFNPVLPAKFVKTEFVFLACSQPRLQMHVLDQMEGNPFAVCDTIEIYIKESRKDLDRLLKRCQGFIINDSEARLISGEHNLVAAAKGMVRKYKPSFLVVKKGEHGGLLAFKDGIVPFPAYPLEKVADPTGAGDSFAGGFMGSLARAGKVDAKTLRAAIADATSVASIACQGVANAALLKATARDVKARSTAFAKMLRLD